ncbi:dienelactone hydrolase family protein [Bailinhaonella thermotolerans]|uniref:Dienelactone hydrolase family protein n=1 Tax=Bailinhaonella thermotolerans TaxID=1070861 RepID=A0A3A4AWV5_9ACTN|nr:dienelactone hydrolase family protein [Bailinhaonella thermotolerans]RJL30407.1 dienelactone hydrolase family protein [Bailinhaonella thermotolerans]
MTLTRVETVTTADGGFDLPLWLPPAGSGPAVLVIQEIYGVGEYIRKVCEDLAALGYVAAAPDLFWRLQPNWRSSHDEEGTKRSIEMGARFDFAQGVADSITALRHLTALPEVTGKTGVLGFCLGGTVAYGVAAEAEPDALVSLYGSGVPDMLDALPRITCPAQFHFGGSDPYITRDRVARVEEAVAAHPGAEILVEEEAGHAFHNFVSPIFHNPEAGARAWRSITAFLARHLTP